MDEPGPSEERHARLLAAKLQQMGVATQLEEGASSAAGVLRLSATPFPTLEMPFVAELARFYTLGPDRIKFFEPAPFFVLEALDVTAYRTQPALEGALRRAWALYLRDLESARSWLRDLGVESEIDRLGVRLFVPIWGVEGPPAGVRSRHALMLPSSGRLRDVSLRSPEQRVYRPESIEHPAELEIGITHEAEKRARAAERESVSQSPANEMAHGEDPARPSHRVLLIDDERSVRLAAENAFSIRGLRVEAFPDPHLGLQALRRRNYDAVLLDAHMPRMDGMELAAHILDLPGIARLPVVLLDERPSVASRKIAEGVGATGYLAKPSHWGNLADRMVGLLEAWTQRRFHRFPARLKVELNGARGGSPDLTQTVGRGGIYVRSSGDGVLGATSHLEIDLPGRRDAIRAQGKVVYRLAQPGDTRVGLGFRFLQFADTDESRWIAVIEGLARRA
jgi:CheY-like chemotaxis protein